MKSTQGLVAVDFTIDEVIDIFEKMYGIKKRFNFNKLTKIVNLLNKMYIEEEINKIDESIIRDAVFLMSRYKEYEQIWKIIVDT